MNPRTRSFLLRSWWLWAFFAITFVAYFHAISKKDKEIQEVVSRLRDLEKEKTKTLEEREDLLSRIQSQSDPAWIEMVLMRELGVVPEGKIKVHFK